MKRGVTLILVVLFLTFRQGEPFLQVREHIADKVIIEEAGFLFTESGIGLIQDNDRSDPFDLLIGVPVCQKDEQSLNQDIIEKDFIQSFLYHPNLMLLDRPPPVMII